MPFTMRELTFLTRPWQQFTLVVLMGALLGILGPFATFERLPLDRRLTYWLVCCVGVWLCILPMGEGVRRLCVRWSWSLSLPQVAVAAALLGALPGTAVVWGISRWASLPPPMGPLELYAYVALISLAATLPLSLYLGRPAPAEGRPAAEPPSSPPAEVPFLARIPPHLGGDLLAVEAEDHYLRVHTALGSDLILMRLSDALRELEGIEGLKVHRSWWVARSALARVDRTGQRACLILVTGQKVPVSRSQLPALKAARWLG